LQVDAVWERLSQSDAAGDYLSVDALFLGVTTTVAAALGVGAGMDSISKSALMASALIFFFNCFWLTPRINQARDDKQAANFKALHWLSVRFNMVQLLVFYLAPDSRRTNAIKQTKISLQGASCDSLTVLFDGSCPLCRREIAVYQSLTPLQTVSWLDVSKDTTDLNQTNQARYVVRFHVQFEDGRQISGAAAFVVLWLVMPGWRWLGRVGRLSGVTPALELAYRAFLQLWPHLQRWAQHAEPDKRLNTYFSTLLTEMKIQ
jgi:predicted DCC family thiol-disulfide oxidoreductase YuxK